MRYFIIAGEASGDIHAADLIKALCRIDSEADFRFFGGDLMTSAAGREPNVHFREMAYMGFVEVVKHLGTILGFLNRAKRIIDEFHPDAVILVDYPSFNLKVARYAHGLKIPVFYYISPKVWAWKEFRVKQIKQYVTELYSILPFEIEFYQTRHNYRVDYVGNPTVTEIRQAKQSFRQAKEFRLANGLPAQGKIVALVPGSRRKEIEQNLPVMMEACDRIEGVIPVIACAPSIDNDLYVKVLGGKKAQLLRGQTFELVYHSTAALVTSGTATLETAVIGAPQVVCYRMNGGPLLYKLREWVLKVKYISLPNLIVDRQIVTELLIHHCNADRILAELRPLLTDSAERQAMLSGYADMSARLGTADCANTAASRILAHLRS